jgi:hypothetical protein
MQDLGGLAGFNFISTRAMSADGSAVGGQAINTSVTASQRAFMWTAATGMVDLNQYLPTRGINLGGWVLDQVTGFDANGRTIAGVGRHEYAPGQMRPEGWVARLDRMCPADCNADWLLSVADFGCFQTAFVLGNLYADCNADSMLTTADFGCFQNLFVLGCP